MMVILQPRMLLSVNYKNTLLTLCGRDISMMVILQPRMFLSVNYKNIVSIVWERYFNDGNFTASYVVVCKLQKTLLALCGRDISMMVILQPRMLFSVNYKNIVNIVWERYLNDGNFTASYVVVCKLQKHC